ncbi:MAG: MFS transporter [Sporolactobacillus sp.]
MRAFAIASCALYFLGGLTSIVVGSVLPELLHFYRLSYTIGGQMIFIGALGFMTGVIMTSWLNRRMSAQLLLAAAALTMAGAQALLGLLPPFGLFEALLFLNSIGSAMIGIVVATQFINVFIGRQAVAMSYLEVSFGLGAFLMPFFAGLLIASGLWRFVFVPTAMLGFILSVIWMRMKPAEAQPATNEGKAGDASRAEKIAVLSPRMKRIALGLFALIIFAYGGLEGSLNNYTSSFFIHYLGAAAWLASAGVGTFWGAMVIGRALTGLVIRKITYGRYLLSNICAAILALVAFIVLKNVWAGFVFMVLLGLALSGVYSITLVYANFTIPNNAHIVTPVISGLSGLGSAVFPALTGLLIDRTGPGPTLWYIVLIACIYLLTLLSINRIRRGRLPHLHLFRHSRETLSEK